jgi:hypothetical protein
MRGSGDTAAASAGLVARSGRWPARRQCRLEGCAVGIGAPGNRTMAQVAVRDLVGMPTGNDRVPVRGAVSARASRRAPP